MLDSLQLSGDAQDGGTFIPQLSQRTRTGLLLSTLTPPACSHQHYNYTSITELDLPISNNQTLTLSHCILI